MLIMLIKTNGPQLSSCKAEAAQIRWPFLSSPLNYRNTQMSAISSLVCSNIFRNGFFQCLSSISSTITPLQLKTRSRSLVVLSNEDELVPTYSTRRRALNVSILTVLLSIPFSSFAIAIGEVLELERYTDSAEGFTLLKPSSWSKVRFALN